jgi:DNA-binding response OmpR family regulator
MSRSILVIEDYPDLRAAISELLTQNDCVCDSVGSEGAIARLEANQYETILLAPRLAIRGDPVLHYLAEKQPAELSRVVVMTCPGQEDDEADARCHVLAKPFNREQLLAVIR